MNNKKILKKFLSFILSFVLIFTAAPFLPMITALAASSSVKSGSTGACTWKLDGMVLTISGNGEMGNYIPKELTDPTPGAGTLKNNSPWGTSITKVIIEQGVTKIGKYCFYDSSISEVIIPDSVTNIDSDAFMRCRQLKNINLPINLKYIGSEAFAGCSKLVNVCIPDSVTSLGESSFADCTSLEGLSLSKNISVIRYGTFQNCAKLSEFQIPNSIRQIGSYAFEGCNSLNNIIIPQNVKSIGNFAFSQCKNLNITILENVTDIGEYAFGNCSNLTVRTKKETNIYYYIKNNSINCTLVVIMDEIPSIEYRFEGRTLIISGEGEMPNYNLFTSTPWYEMKDNIERIIIGKGIRKVGTYSFYGFNNLKEVITENQNLKLGLYALNGKNENLYVYSYSGGALESNCKNASLNFSGFFETFDLVGEITESTISMQGGSNIFYKIGSRSWSGPGSVYFTGLKPETEYIIYIKKQENGIVTYGKPLMISTTKVAKPILSYVSDTVIRVVYSNSRLEYSIDLKNWKTKEYSNDIIFSGLNPGTEYNIYARVKDSQYNVCSDPLRVITKKRTVPQARTPIISEYNTGCVSLSEVDGYEYCIYEREYKSKSNGETYTSDSLIGDWQSSNTFTGIEKNKVYILYQRKAETTTDYASETSRGVLFSIPEKPEIVSIGAIKLIVKEISGFEYSLDKINWQKDTIFTNLIDNMDYTVYQRLADTYSENAYKIISDGADFHTTLLNTGDINGDDVIDIRDLISLKKYFAKQSEAVVPQECLDVSGDGEINSDDLVALRKKLLFQ